MLRRTTAFGIIAKASGTPPHASPSLRPATHRQQAR